MSELRAPDPTLTALGGDRFVKIEFDSSPPVAHRWEDGPAPPGEYPLGCGSPGDWLPQMVATVARWFAVPCRACFPDAVAPGTTGCRDREAYGPHGPRCIGAYARYLSWQVSA